jgi:lysophospholipase L1-like esterase
MLALSFAKLPAGIMVSTAPRLLALIGLAVALAAPPALAQSPIHWTGSWMASQQVPEPQNALPPDALKGATLRQVIHLSLGGPQLRIRVSNAFGSRPLLFASVHVARAKAGGAIDPATDRVVTFSGARQIVAPAGAEYWSDPVALPVAAGDNLAISLHFDAAPDGQTSHPGSRATSWLAPGDQTSEAALHDAKTFEHWFQLSGVDVAAAPNAFAVVTLGDSITDGHGATTNGDDRWPDDLARRLAAAGKPAGVLNAGIGGNRVLLDGLGPNAVARTDRDVLSQTEVRALIVLEGINDLGMLTRDAPAGAEAHKALVADIVAGYGQIIAAARAHHVRVLGATILPDAGSSYYHPNAENEADRQAVNAWIRAPGHFDGVIDFDAVMRDPAHPDRLLAAYDSGDGLHPSPAGYRAMAETIPLPALTAP